MTLKAVGVRGEILAFLSDNPKRGWSDNEIAGAIGRPLPSVRRTRLELEREDRIRLAPNASSQILRWQRN